MKQYLPSSRNSHLSRVDESVELFLEAFKIKDKVEETYFKESWPGIVGHTVASRTSKLYFQDHALVVVVDSAPLRHQLHTARERILNIVRQFLPEKNITEVVIK